MVIRRLICEKTNNLKEKNENKTILTEIYGVILVY